MQNFGKIKDSFNDLLINGLRKEGDSGKKLFQKYLKTIKESEVLRTQFLVYHNIENRVDDDVFSANLFVSENIKLMDVYDRATILKENEKLSSLLPELKGEYGLSSLHESLSNLIFTKKTVKNIDAVTTDMKNVVSHITSNKSKEISEGVDLPISVLTKLMTEKYNEKYDTMSEVDKLLIKKVINTNFDGKKAIYTTTVNECVDLIDKLVTESDSPERLLKVKDKLLKDIECLSENDFGNKFSNLIELKANLMDSK